MEVKMLGKKRTPLPLRREHIGQKLWNDFQVQLDDRCPGRGRHSILYDCQRFVAVLWDRRPTWSPMSSAHGITIARLLPQWRNDNVQLFNAVEKRFNFIFIAREVHRANACLGKRKLRALEVKNIDFGTHQRHCLDKMTTSSQLVDKYKMLMSQAWTYWFSRVRGHCLSFTLVLIQRLFTFTTRGPIVFFISRKSAYQWQPLKSGP